MADPWRTIIVEDETASVKTLRNLIEQEHPAIQVLAVCRDPQSARQSIMQHRPDLLFLDIQLPEENDGFRLLDDLKVINFDIIIMTGFPKDTYVNQVIKLTEILDPVGIRFLYKPIKGQALSQALQDIAQQRQSKDHPQNREATINVLRENQKLKGQNRVVLLEEGQPLIKFGVRELHKILLKQVCYCEANENYVRFFIDNPLYTRGKSIMGRLTMKELDMCLEHLDFFRIHLKYLINLHCVEKVDFSSVIGSGGMVEISCGGSVVCIPIGRDPGRRADFIQALRRIGKGHLLKG